MRASQSAGPSSAGPSSASPPGAGSPARPEPPATGRPRHYQPEAERTMLIRAARRLLREQPYGEVTVAAILASSGLHTRAFYRHFRTKDELLLSIYWENAEELHRILVARTEAAPSPIEAVSAWVDEILRLRLESRSVAYVSIFDDPAAKEALRATGGEGIALPAVLAPLHKALAAGRADGSLPKAVPEVHGAFVWALVWNDLSWAPAAAAEERRAAALASVMSFLLDGLGRKAGAAG